MEKLHLVTWLSPGLPYDLFDWIRGELERTLELPVTLESRTKLSGPGVGSSEPFGTGQADLGFMCAPACVSREVRQRGGYELLGLAPLFDDPLYENCPYCYCDILVHADSSAGSLADLRGARFGYNDPVSLSGWLGLSSALESRHESMESYFGQTLQTGGHLKSLVALLEGSIDVASIDSNVLRSHPGASEGLRCVERLGPWPSQPVVVRASLAMANRARVREALKALPGNSKWGFMGFREQSEADLTGVPSAAAPLT